MKLYKFFVLVCLFCVGGLALGAVHVENDIIKKIAVEGNTRTENATIISYSKLAVGESYDKQKSDESLKRLYETGFFSDVALKFKDGTVTIVVEENPIISGIYFKGNKALKSDSLLLELVLQKRGYFSKSKLKEDVNRIIELYSKLGKFSVTVDPKISKLPQNRVDILFDLKEGEKLKIEKISFVGNKRFSSNDLKQALLSKENRIFNILRSTHYNSDAVEYDKIALKRFYTSRGYADFRVISVNVEVKPDNMDKAYITFVLDEGALYHFGQIKVQNNIATIKSDVLLGLGNLKEGDVFNSAAVEDLNSGMIQYLAEKGFPFVQVEYEYALNKAKKTVDVQYKVSKGAKVYIGKINISGNSKTHDYVIRRELRLSEGDPYNGFLVDRSEQKIRDLDYFDKVSVAPVRTGKSDVVDIDVKVTEKSTAHLKFAAGYSTTDGPMATIDFKEINWLGKGKQFSCGIQKTAFTTGLNVGASEPHFRGTEVEVGVGAGFSAQKNNAKGLAKLGADHSDIPFNEDSYYGSVFMSYDIMEYLNYHFDYSLKLSKTTSVAKTENKPLLDLLALGKHTTSAIGHTFTYSKANSAIKPTNGYIATLTQTLAGIGGSVNYLKQVLKGSYYYPVTEDLVFKLAAEGGYASRIGNKAVRIEDNFYLGDSTFRGFDYAGVGPRDKGTLGKSGNDGYSLGGVAYYKGTAEFQFPFPGIQKDVDLTMSVFSDVGSAWGIDVPKKLKKQYTRDKYNDSTSIRASVGFGFIWITRAGPLRIDFARAMKKEKFDKTKEILFSYSTAL